jgi:hypothetical protein
MRYNVAVTIVALALTACATRPVAMRVEYFAGAPSYPRQPFIQVLTQPPSMGYQKIARIRATGGSGLSETQVLDALEQKARDLGANAVIINNITRHESSTVNYNPSGGQYAFTQARSAPSFDGLAIHIETNKNELLK